MFRACLQHSRDKKDPETAASVIVGKNMMCSKNDIMMPKEIQEG